MAILQGEMPSESNICQVFLSRVNNTEMGRDQVDISKESQKV